jgi:hypothetical protein
MWKFARSLIAAAIACGVALTAAPAYASDHLDSPSVTANPSADIGDLYAWMDPGGGRLNIVMTLVGHSFSDRLDYIFYIDSGPRFGRTHSTRELRCRFASMTEAACRLNGEDRAVGDPSQAAGLTSERGGFRVFAGLRDDPFFNNVRGTRAMYQIAIAALQRGAPLDAAGCPRFDEATLASMSDAWRHTDGGPARNFLMGWTPAVIVVSIELDRINQGGPLLAMWGATRDGRRQIDRMGRPLTGNALLATTGTADVANPLKEAYNAARPATAARFVPEIERGLSFYDGFDGHCGNQLLAAPEAAPHRYRALAQLLADDRLWVNSLSTSCGQLFAVELAHIAGDPAYGDCGGRTPNYDAVNVYRSLLVTGDVAGVTDGVDHDERVHSTSVFPFLAPPDPAPAS